MKYQEHTLCASNVGVRERRGGWRQTRFNQQPREPNKSPLFVEIERDPEKSIRTRRRKEQTLRLKPNKWRKNTISPTTKEQMKYREHTLCASNVGERERRGGWRQTRFHQRPVEPNKSPLFVEIERDPDKEVPPVGREKGLPPVA